MCHIACGAAGARCDWYFKCESAGAEGPCPTQDTPPDDTVAKEAALQICAIRILSPLVMALSFDQFLPGSLFELFKFTKEPVSEACCLVQF